MTSVMSSPAARVPFAPLNEARLQNLTSIKNRQNAYTPLNASSKRKAASYESDIVIDAENIDPSRFSAKKSKAVNVVEPVLVVKVPSYTPKPIKPRSVLSTYTSVPKPAPVSEPSIIPHASLSAPAGRSPTRKRSGLLPSTRRSIGTPYTRVDPPSFGLPSSPRSASGSLGLGFSIGDALSSTVPTTYVAPPIVQKPKVTKQTWEFTIYEDTAEELATNLMEHSTCILDISSDEESSAREIDARGKENVPPENDVSQTSTRPSHASTQARATRKAKLAGDNMAIDRTALKEMDIKQFWPNGKEEMVIVLGDDDILPESPSMKNATSSNLNISEPVETLDVAEVSTIVDRLVAQEPAKDATPSTNARLLEPIEKAEEGFQLWESGSVEEAE